MPAEIENIDASQLGEMAEIPQEMAASLVEDLPDQAAFEAALKTYITLILDGIKEGQKEQKTIAVGETSQQVTATTWQIGQKDVLNLAVAVLEKAQTDETVKQFITAVCNYANDYASSLIEQTGVSVNALKPEDVLAAIPSLIEEIKKTETTDTSITVVLYTDEKNNLRGLVFKDVEGNTVVDYRAVTAGDKTVMEILLPEEVVLKGEATTGTTSYELLVATESMVKIELDSVNGVIRLIPGAALLEEMSKDIPVLAMAGSMAPELRLSRKDKALKLELWVNGKCFLGIAYGAEAGEAYVPVKPEQAASSENTLALMSWLSKLNLDPLTQALKDAGVPQDYMDALVGLVGQLIGIG